MDKSAARKLLNAYMYDPTFIPSQYGLAPLPELVASGGVLGATRFAILPSFEPERIFTILFRQAEYRDRVGHWRNCLMVFDPTVRWD
jgi:hypothetical protein